MYPDNSEPLTEPTVIIENVNEMIEEERKYLGDNWVSKK